MDTKTIALAAICPVLLFGCEAGEAPDAPGTSPAGQNAGYAGPAPLYAVSRPDSMEHFIVLTGDSPLVVVETTTGDAIARGDTVALCSHPFLEIETERINMQLEIALATEDTAAVDSLGGYWPTPRCSSRWFPPSMASWMSG